MRKNIFLTYCILCFSMITAAAYSATLQNNVSATNLSATTGNSISYDITVPSSAQNLTITITGGTGAADLYVRYGAQPTTSSYDCRPFINGNEESCSFSSPSTGVYYIVITAFRSFTGLTLTASYDTNEDSGNTNGEATWDGFSNYYSDAIGLTGSSLIYELNIIAAQGHSRMSYSQVWDALEYTDEDPNNDDNIILIYTGRSQAKSFSSSGNNDQDAWNREHSWPSSHGFPSTGDWGYTDIHHLRPSDASVNSTRGNKDYDDGGSEISEASGNYTDSDSFEPRDDVKGDLARMMFYMDIRYNGSDSTSTDDLTLVNYTGTSGANLGKLCTLLTWHMNDPVGTEEINRHSRIVEVQGNRNPFVDYPAWAQDIWGDECGL